MKVKIYHNFIIFFIILFQIIKKINVNPVLLNNIIELAGNRYIYSHISFNSDGDMIIDSSTSNNSGERKFYGLKKNGRFYFNITNYELGYFSMTVQNEKPRYEGESFFIKLTSNNTQIHGRELLLGVSKNIGTDSGFYTEIYNLNDNNYTKYKTYNILGWLIGDTFSIMESLDESDPNYYYYTFCYCSLNEHKYYFNIRKIYFSFDLPEGYYIKEKKIEKINYSRIVSAYYTENKILICFDANENQHLMITAYNSNLEELITKEINDTEIIIANNRYFMKGIHLKNEIGIFIYFIQNIPKVSIIQYNSNNTFNSLFREINLDKADFTFDIDYMMNDIVKLNNNQICYISISSEKEHFQFIVLTLYKNDQLINIKYYQIEIGISYNMKLANQLKASLYNQFIALAFTHSEYNETNSNKYCSLIIFNYPSSEDNSLDIIPILYNTNKNIENDFSFNFEGKLIVDNNLFGLVYKGIKIIRIPNDIYLINTENKKIILNDSIILKNENVSLSFDNHDNYISKNYIIEYSYVLEEPDYDSSSNNSYLVYFDDILGNQIEDEKNYYQNNNYIGKSSDFTLIISEDLTTNCNNDLCSLCFSNYSCITCTYNYTFNENSKTCLPNIIMDIKTTILTTIPTTIPTTIITKLSTTITTTILTTIPSHILSTRPTIQTIILTTTIDNHNLYYEDKNDCTEKEILESKCNRKISNKQIEIISEKLKQTISPDSNLIIETKNVKFQISSLEIQKNNNHPNISSVELGLCEEILKKQEGLSEESELIIFKTDIKNEDLSNTFVQYEIYNPLTLDRINMEVCKNISIGINVPVNLDENIKEIYYSLNHSGYNLFDLNDPFYNDISSTYTTKYGTDLTLIDRKDLIYDKTDNISICQVNCTFKFYNLTNGKAKCDYDVQIEETITNEDILRFSATQIVNSFYKTLKNSNFLVLKCYKLVFSKKGQKNNIGSYLLSGITFIFIVLIIIYIFNGNKKLNKFIQSILNIKLNYRHNYSKNTIAKSFEKDYNGFISSSFKSHSSLNEKLSGILENQNKNKIDYIKNKNIYLDKYKIKDLNDEELNNLDYENALILDKRTFLQYYFSLLKKKHLIIFTFNSNDYNLMTVKISLLLLSFSLYFTINGFFFSDATMHKINEDKGVYNFLFQIPQILYSTIVSAIINMILKILSLSEKQILIIKSQRNYRDALEKLNSIKKSLRIKKIFFCIISFILMLFFWYFISAFCAVYKNTQIILIKDTLISFALSMIYPFGLNLLPGLFRIPALRSIKQDKECLYKTSRIIALV